MKSWKVSYGWIWDHSAPRPKELPHFYTSVRLVIGHVNAMVELKGQDSSFWCFSTSKNGKGKRALTIGMYEGKWDVARLARSQAGDIYNMLHENDKKGSTT
jgi:hypothetical protein